MPELSKDDLENQKVERDEHGELIPDEYTVELNGEAKDVEVKPLSGGLGNRIAKYEDGIRELDPKALAAVLSACYVTPDLSDLRASDVEDYPLDVLQELIRPITEQMPEGEPEGNR